MKKFLSLFLSTLMLISIFTGCSKAPEKVSEDNATIKNEEKAKTDEESKPKVKKSDTKLVFMSNIAGAQFDVLEDIGNSFADETGITIEAISPGSNYEELMKTKMASKDLPDLWTTHGWSVARYSEYLRSLNDQPWANNINPSIEPLITDSEGKIYVLPMDVDLAGIVYNETVIKNADVNVDEIKTWDDFEIALEKIKESGATPIHIGGKDSWTIGQFFDWVAPTFYTTNDNKNFRKELKDGSFDWNEWGKIASLLDKWNEKGYFNKDCLTADYATAAKAFAEDKIGFEFYGNYIIQEAHKVNPNAKLRMMPIPSLDSDDEPVLIGGERTAIGIWNETEYEKEALQFINYLAKAENISKVASSNSLPAGLKGIDSDKGVVTADYDKYANVKTIPYFDREYLPSGMWDDMCITGAEILSGKEGAIENCIKHMEQSYKDKLSQQ